MDTPMKAETPILARQEILYILQARKLDIPNMEMLPIDELQRIYESFAVPLTKREIHSMRNFRASQRVVPLPPLTDTMMSISERERQREFAIDLGLDMTWLCSPYGQNHDKRMQQWQYYKKLADQYESSRNIKRILIRAPTAEEHLTSATKRIRIN